MQSSWVAFRIANDCFVGLRNGIKVSGVGALLGDVEPNCQLQSISPSCVLFLFQGMRTSPPSAPPFVLAIGVNVSPVSLVYDRPMDDLKQKLFKTRLFLIAVALTVAGLAMGLHRLMR